MMTSIGTGLEAALRNNLLRALRPADLSLLLPALEPVPAVAGAVLFEPGDNVRFAYFPCGPTVLAFIVPLADGQAVETAPIGREGAVGGIVSSGRLPAFSRAVVQVPGPMLRIGVASLEAAKLRSLSLRHLFARYADCLMAQIFQNVACNAAHSIEQRAAKWLLMTMDRTGEAELKVTHEDLAAKLGVGRSYISRVLQSLSARGVLQTRRGALRVARPEALAALSCGCRDAVRRHFDEVLKGVYPEGED
jgi:transcriptional regulator with XRE-family HTH domain